MKSKHFDPLLIVLDMIIVALLVAILFMSFTFGFFATHMRSGFVEDSSSFSFMYENQNYAGMVMGKYMNQFNNIGGTEDFECLADYYEAASYYKIYRGKGDTSKADEMKKRMAEDRSQMDGYEILADHADEIFEVYEPLNAK